MMKFKKLRISLMTASLSLVLAFSFSFSAKSLSAKKPVQKKHPGIPWNGGKPQPPFLIQSNLDEVVSPNANLDLQVQVTPERDCMDLTTKIRGLDGVVVMGEIEKHLAQGKMGQPHIHSVTVRVPNETAGYAVVDVSCSIEGSLYSTSKPIPFRTAKESAFKKTNPAMKVQSDHQNEPLILMSPEVH